MLRSTAPSPASIFAGSLLEDSSQLMRGPIGVNAKIVSVLARASLLVTGQITTPS